MRTLVISDIHANLVALQAVLQSVSCERIVCLGDIVGYGSQPSECVELIFSKCDFVVQGNHDESVIMAKEPQEKVSEAPTQGKLWNLWTAGELSEKQVMRLRKAPKQIKLHDDGLDLIFCHNICRSQYIYARSPEYIFSDFTKKHPGNIVFFGHSHSPFKRKVGDCLFVNTGSIGQPRQGKVQANCAILEDGRVEILNIQYDTAQVLKSLQKLPLHDEYLDLWNKFSHQAIVDKQQISEIETKIHVENKKKSGMQNVSW